MENSDLDHSTTTDKENDYLDKLYSKQTSYSQSIDESSSQNPKKKLWTPTEDNKLVNLVDKFGDQRWNKVSKCMPGRSEI